MGSNSKESKDKLLKMNVYYILENLIKIDTTNPSGNEMDAAIFLKNLLDKFGFETKIVDLGNNRANFIASLGSDNGPELMFNGHLDVVPAIGDWRYPPFSMCIEKDKIFGRGSADMKGGLAAMCQAAIELSQNKNLIKGKLKLVFVADEEDANLGTLDYLKNNKASDYAIIGEPTGLNICTAHRGVSRDYIEIYAPSRHAALPETDEDAISLTAKVINLVHKLNDELNRFKHDLLPSPSVSITMIEGYEKDNVVPGKVKLLLDFRILPGMSHDFVINLIKDIFVENKIEQFELVPHFYMPGGETDYKDKFVISCQQILEKEGYESRIHSFGASCEQCFLVDKGIKTVVLGPGNLNQAHTVDEWIEKRQLEKAVDIYKKIAKSILI